MLQSPIQTSSLAAEYHAQRFNDICLSMAILPISLNREAKTLTLWATFVSTEDLELAQANARAVLHNLCRERPCEIVCTQTVPPKANGNVGYCEFVATGCSRSWLNALSPHVVALQSALGLSDQ